MSTAAVSEGDPLAASRRAFARRAGSGVLDALGWWDLLADLSDAEIRAAMLALFRAQGSELGSSCALGALLARPYLAARSGDGKVAATIRRTSVRRGAIELLVGDAAPLDHVLVDSPGAGASLFPIAGVTLLPIEVPGRLVLHEVVPGETASATLPEALARRARARSLFLGRLAAAFEILGAAEATLALALDYARTRVQFGEPIGAFQAVRHLLAWARTDCAAIEAVARAAQDLDRHAPARFDQVVKALAGRNGRRACERTLQVFGAIGFTAEHPHHHFHGRVLALDAMLGSSFDLTHELGAWLRRTRQVPDLPHALLPGGTRASPPKKR